MGENKGTKDGRARVWTFLVYPYESAPDNWREIIDNECVPWVESPLHDPDPDSLNENEHDYRHHHIEIIYSSLKSYNQVEEITKKLNATRPFVVNDVRSMTRYFAHLDHPDKQQFSPSEIISHCGADINAYLISMADRYEYIAEMQQFIIDNNITEFWVMLDLCRQFHRDTWFPLLCDNCAFVINLFIKSFRHDPENVTKLLQDKTLVIESPEESTN